LARVADGSRREIADLSSRLRSLARRLTTVDAVAQNANVMGAESAKRFRIGSFQTPLVSLGGQVSGSVKWSSPMPSDSYKIDATCPAMGNTVWSYTITNQTAAGCTVNFTAPVLLSLGTIVIVLAVSPATTS
jgi:hypothetical protein